MFELVLCIGLPCRMSLNEMVLQLKNILKIIAPHERPLIKFLRFTPGAENICSSHTCIFF